MKMSSRLSVVALLLVCTSVPVTVMAVDYSTAAASSGPISLPTPPSAPVDGNPTGPPRVVAGR